MRWILMLAWICFLMACGAKQEFSYDEEKYAAIMADLAIQGQLIKKTTGRVKDSLDSLYRIQIEEIHDISLKEYEMNLLHIQTKPSSYKELVDRSFELLKKREQDIAKRKKK